LRRFDVAHPNVPYFKSWLIFSVSSVLLALLCGMAIGFVLGMIMGIIGVPIETVKFVCGIAGLLLGLLVSFAMFRWVIDRFVIPSVLESARNVH
jgi:hypothetical protein